MKKIVFLFALIVVSLSFTATLSAGAAHNIIYRKVFSNTSRMYDDFTYCRGNNYGPSQDSFLKYEYYDDDINKIFSKTFNNCELNSNFKMQAESKDYNGQFVEGDYVRKGGVSDAHQQGKYNKNDYATMDILY